MGKGGHCKVAPAISLQSAATTVQKRLVHAIHRLVRHLGPLQSGLCDPITRLCRLHGQEPGKLELRPGSPRLTGEYVLAIAVDEFISVISFCFDPLTRVCGH